MTSLLLRRLQELFESRRDVIIAALASVSIAVHLVLAYGLHWTGKIGFVSVSEAPLVLAILLGGLPLVWDLLRKALHFEFGADLLAGIAIVTAILLGEYLAGSLVVLMLSGGAALESYAVRNASSVLQALARRMPTLAHRKRGSAIEDVLLHDVKVHDELVVMPHEICPVDGTVIEGRGSMDESYLTGEPYIVSKVVGSTVLSGAINGAAALTIRSDRLAIDSRYARIMEVMRQAEQRRPKLRRLGDQLGALYTPVALVIAGIAWALTGDPVRFLAVLVIATPCPLLIAIPVAIIGSISLAARRSIIIKDPTVLEKIDTCQTAIFDKTGTLTYGQPRVTGIETASGFNVDDVLAWVASVERYSKHPLSMPTIEAAKQRGLATYDVKQVSELPGEGLKGSVDGREIRVTSRKKFAQTHPEEVKELPPVSAGMECLVLIDERWAGLIHYRDEPRTEGASFIDHLGPKHRFHRVMIISGDRETEVRFLADQVGIELVYAGQSPEEKLERVRAETKSANTVFLGDGINDAPALAAATVGIAFGQNSDITAEAAGAVIMESSLQKVDELIHIGKRLRRIALESAIGGMALSVIGMFLAAFGYLPPVPGAVTQEVIDVAAVVNALRAAVPPRQLIDF